MSIKDWPEQLQPREKLLASGAASLSDAELLAIFLRTGLAGVSALELASEMLDSLGGLRPLFNSNESRLTRIRGIGPAKFAQLSAITELNQRYLKEQLQRQAALSDPENTRNYLISLLRDRRREVFLALYLDNRHRVICHEELFKGTIDGAAVYPRVVAERALSHNAAAIIVAHNHPSGVSEPSSADEAITRRLRDALALLDIRLLDHFVIGDGRPVSLAERGIL
ncbi:MAG: DNA repair protein RadC [Xanthomonadales bacterium]|nr:DNA repair protein RadC [Xanthomonadales bacterium]